MFEVFYIGAAIQGFLLAAFLWVHSARRAAGRFLAVLLLLLSFDQSGKYWLLRQNEGIFSIIYAFTYFLGYLYGPLVYSYAVSLISERPISRKMYLTVIPGLFYLSYSLLFYTLSPEEQKLEIERFKNSGLTSLELLVETLVYISNIIYFLAIIPLLQRHRRKVEEGFSSRHSGSLVWLQALIIINLFAWIIAGLSFVFYFYKPNWSLGLENLLYLAIAASIYVIGYFTLFRAAGFQRLHRRVFKEMKPAEETITPDSPLKYARTRLDQDTARKYQERIHNYMQEEQAYLDPELNIQDLAERIEIPAYLISQVINSREGLNFFHYVNRFRISAAQEALKDPERKEHTVLRIAFDSGFNSKSTFNSIFKKFTGTTPGEFRKKIKTS